MRTLSLVLVVLLAGVVLSGSADAGAPDDDPTAAILLDYQAAEAFRDRLRPSVALVRVEAEVLPGCDPDFRPVQTGAAALVRFPGRDAPVFVTAAPLVRGAHRITLVARLAATDTPLTAEARVVRRLDEPGVALLAPTDPDALKGMSPLPANAAPEALDAGRPVFTLENLASGMEVLLRGQVDAPGEPPLVDLRVVSLRVGAGEPLIDAHGRFAGVCFRRLTASDRRCFASRAHDILAALKDP